MPHSDSTALERHARDVQTPPEAANGPVLRIHGLSKRFVLHARQRNLDALANVSLEASPGRFTTLVGASGSGKSTVLKCVYRTYRPTSGTIEYVAADGQRLDLATLTEAQILHLRRREIRFVNQFLATLPRQTALHVVARPLRELGTSTDDALLAARTQLKQVGLSEHLWELPPNTFSGGERQLVNLARALVVHPRLLLLDEPTSSLDPRSTEFVVTALERLKQREIAILAVLHDRALVERLSDEVVSLTGGVDLARTSTEADA